MAASTLETSQATTTAKHSSPTIKREHLTGFDTPSDHHRCDAGFYDDTAEFDLSAAPAEHSHRLWDVKQADAEFANLKSIANGQLLGDLEDPGALSTYHKHRLCEQLTADWLYRTVVPHARKLKDWDTADHITRTVFKMLSCRQGGPFGLNELGKLVVAWDEKCSHSKLCPDEARHEAQRLRERYMHHLAERKRQGCRVYKAVLTLPNYPGGRLLEGQRHIFSKFRNRLMRRREKFGIEGALAIMENPLGKHRDWNIHLNVVFVCRRWLSYKDLRAEWGAQLDVREVRNLDEAGQAALFNELVKYAVRPVPDKSSDPKHKSDAPAMIEWTGAEGLEWWKATHGFSSHQGLRLPVRDRSAGTRGRHARGVARPPGALSGRLSRDLAQYQPERLPVALARRRGPRPWFNTG